MKSLQLLCFCSILFIRPAVAHSFSTDAFKLVKKQGTTSLYERWIILGGAEVREIKAEFTARTDATSVVDLFKNESKGTQWNTGAKAYRIVPFTDPHRWVAYIKYDIPWPMQDQDCLLNYEFRERGKVAEIEFQSTVSQEFPVFNNVSRITGTRGKMILEEQQTGDMKITYLITTDRSSKIPRWVSDPIIHDHLFKTITRFKGLLENK